MMSEDRRDNRIKRFTRELDAIDRLIRAHVLSEDEGNRRVRLATYILAQELTDGGSVQG